MSFRKSLLIIILAVIGVASLNVWAMAAPKLKIGEEIFDFGFTPEGYPVSHKYWVYNTGDEILMINAVRPSCGCTSVPLTKSRLDPGDSVGLELKFDTRRFKGQITKTASVETNDKTQTDAKLKFTAKVGTWEGAIIANPSKALLDTLGKTSQSIMLKNTSTDTYKLSIISGPADFMTAALSSTELPSKGEVVLSLGSTPKTPIGEYNSSITLHFDGPEPHNITIPIYGVGYIQ